MTSTEAHHEWRDGQGVHERSWAGSSELLGPLAKHDTTARSFEVLLQFIIKGVERKHDFISETVRAAQRAENADVP